MIKLITVKHDWHDLIRLFNQCFAQSYNTRLIKGDDEPLYLPKHAAQPFHAIFFAHGYFSSALHECAHWLLAGSKRRQQTDYGYWYAADGRNIEQQRLFEQVEVKPQALEWILAKACNYKFHCSVDNLTTEETINSIPFKKAIYQQVMEYCQKGLNKRATLFRQSLCDFYQTTKGLECQQFSESELAIF